MTFSVKRMVSILLVAVFAIAMLTSCSVVKENPLVLKVGDLKYTFEDYAELFNSELYAYVYSGGEAQYCPNYQELSSTERLKEYQDYVYDKLVDIAIKDYLVEQNGLADKLTEEDKTAIAELVEENLEASASSFESDVTESSTTLEGMKNDGYKLTEEEQDSIEETADTQIEAAVATKMSTTDDTQGSDDTTPSGDTALSGDAVPSGDTAASDDTQTSDGVGEKTMTREEAELAVAEEAGYDTYEDYVAGVKEDVEFDLYFAYYKKDAALEKYKESLKTDDDEDADFDTHKKDVEEEEKQNYLRDTKLPEYLLADLIITDDEAKTYYDEKIKEYKDMAEAEDASSYYTYLDEAMNEEDGTVWYTADGYYYVKHILLKNIETDATKSSDTTVSSDTAASDDTLTANVDPKVQAEVEEKLDAVKAESSQDKKLTEFAELVKEYGEDPGMQQEPNMSTGYLMGKGNNMVPEFADACEKLYNNGKGKIGDISDGVVSEHGVHYIQLVKKLDAGEIGYESVIDEVKETALESKKSTELENLIEAETKKMSINKYVSRIRSCGNGYESMYFGDTSTGGATSIGG